MACKRSADDDTTSVEPTEECAAPEVKRPKELDPLDCWTVEEEECVEKEEYWARSLKIYEQAGLFDVGEWVHRRRMVLRWDPTVRDPQGDPAITKQNVEDRICQYKQQFPNTALDPNACLQFAPDQWLRLDEHTLPLERRNQRSRLSTLVKDVYDMISTDYVRDLYGLHCDHCRLVSTTTEARYAYAVLSKQDDCRAELVHNQWLVDCRLCSHCAEESPLALHKVRCYQCDGNAHDMFHLGLGPVTVATQRSKEPHQVLPLPLKPAIMPVLYCSAIGTGLACYFVCAHCGLPGPWSFGLKHQGQWYCLTHVVACALCGVDVVEPQRPVWSVFHKSPTESVQRPVCDKCALVDAAVPLQTCDKCKGQAHQMITVNGGDTTLCLNCTVLCDTCGCSVRRSDDSTATKCFTCNTADERRWISDFDRYRQCGGPHVARPKK